MGVLLPDEELDEEEEEDEEEDDSESLAPSVSAADDSCGGGADFVALVEAEPTPLPGPGVYWRGSQLCVEGYPRPWRKPRDSCGQNLRSRTSGPSPCTDRTPWLVGPL